MTKAEEKAIAYQLAAHDPKVIGGEAILSDEEHKYWNINYDFLAGYEEAKKETIERAINWLANKLVREHCLFGCEVEDISREFKKAMEEQQ